MSEDLTGVDGDELVAAALARSDRELRVLHASAEVLASLVRVANERGAGTATVRVLAATGVLKDTMDDFLVASGASALVERGALEIRATEDGDAPPVAIVDDDTVVSFVGFDGAVGALASSDDALLDAATDAFERQWDDGDPHDVRTPPIQTVMASLRDEIGEATAQDVADILDVLDSARGDGDGLDEIAVTLLAAARNEVLLYDISKWGEDNGVASKATFSRKKTEMEEADLIDTENVPIDIGRPRLRLKLADDELREAPVAEVVAAATETLG